MSEKQTCPDCGGRVQQLNPDGLMCGGCEREWSTKDWRLITALRSRVEELEKELFHWRTIGAEHNWAADGGPDEDGEEIWSEYNADVWDMLSGFVEERAKNADLQRRLDAARAAAIGECVAAVHKMHAEQELSAPTMVDVCKKLRALLPTQEGGGS